MFCLARSAAGLCPAQVFSKPGAVRRRLSIPILVDVHGARADDSVVIFSPRFRPCPNASKVQIQSVQTSLQKRLKFCSVLLMSF